MPGVRSGTSSLRPMTEELVQAAEGSRSLSLVISLRSLQVNKSRGSQGVDTEQGERGQNRLCLVWLSLKASNRD